MTNGADLSRASYRAGDPLRRGKCFEHFDKAFTLDYASTTTVRALSRRAAYRRSNRRYALFNCSCRRPLVSFRHSHAGEMEDERSALVYPSTPGDDSATERTGRVGEGDELFTRDASEEEEEEDLICRFSLLLH